MREKLEEIKKNALDVLQKATDIDALEEARIKFLGKKGELTAVLKGMGQLSKEERPQNRCACKRNSRCNRKPHRYEESGNFRKA